MILDDIVDYKREELALQKQQVSLGQLQDMPLFHSQPPDLFQTLSTWNGRTIIAEIKKASPSKGVIRQDFDPLALARSYESSGAAAISVLTEQKFFQGSLEYLKQIRQQLALPLLRKDFIFDDYQVYEARAYGASAILFIVAILEDAQLHDLIHLTRTLGIDCLVEVHDEAECERALAQDVSLLGINNRDLRTFHTTIETTERLVQGLPSDVLVVSESGLSTRHQLDRLEAQGVRAFLIGETFMAAPDPGEPLRSLLGHPT